MMSGQEIKLQVAELLSRHLESRGMTHQELAERINELREGAGRTTVDADALAYRLAHPDLRTGMNTSLIEESCEIMGLLPVLSLVPIRTEKAGLGAVPDDRDLAVLDLCDDDRMTYRASLDDPDMVRLREHGLVKPLEADHVGWSVTEAGRQLLARTRTIAVCEKCHTKILPGKSCDCVDPISITPCELCTMMDAIKNRCLDGHDIDSPSDPCHDWRLDMNAYLRCFSLNI